MIKGAFGALKGAARGVIQQFTQPQPRYQIPVPGFSGGVQRLLPGGATGYMTLRQGPLPGAVGPGGVLGALGARGGVTGAGVDGVPVDACGRPVTCKPKRLNKSGYYVQTQPGSPEAGGTWIAPETQLVAVRRRNLSNGRANSRALSRATGMANQSKRLKKAARTLWHATK